MSSSPSDSGPSPCADVDSTAQLVASDVSRGVCRMLLRHDCVALSEVPLPNGRRADLMALDAQGAVIIVEIKVSRADLLGDLKWPDYLDWCDRYYWAVPVGFDTAPLAGEAFLPERSGIIVADRYDAAVLREAHRSPLSAPMRKKMTLAFARRGARRALTLADPEIEGFN